MGMLGGGGSVLLVPVLLYVLKLELKVALASSQLVLAATSLVAMTVHAQAGRVVYTTGVVFGAAGMVGAYLGGRTAHHVPAKLLLFGFIALMFVSALQMLRKRNGSETNAVAVMPQGGIPWRGAAIGLPTGFVAGLLGAGGGFLIVPALSLFGRLPIDRAVATSLFVITMQAFAGSIGYLEHATVDYRVVGFLSTTMAASSVAGGLISQRMPAALLRQLFAGLLLLAACFMLLRSII
jgi:hypothetical protein